MWLCAKLVNKPLELGGGVAAQALAWKLCLVLLGSHERLEGIKARNASWFPSFLLFPKCGLTIFHLAEGSVLCLGSVPCFVTQAPWALPEEGANPSLFQNPNKTLQLKCPLLT